jgi:predicted nucleic acid-binding protein
MMVIADTSPINYLILISEVEVLFQLFSRITVREGVVTELQHPKAPEAVRAWINAPPTWLQIGQPRTPIDSALQRLGLGEREAIALAEELGADLLLLDERKGYEVAVARGLRVAGTLFVLEEAAVRGLVNLPESLAALQQTSFRVTPELIQSVLDRAARKPAG